MATTAPTLTDQIAGQITRLNCTYSDLAETAGVPERKLRTPDELTVREFLALQDAIGEPLHLDNRGGAL